MTLSRLLIAALALTFGSYVFGRAQSSEKNSIEIGSAVLHLGMAKDSAIAALAKYYNVKDDGWVIAKSGPPYHGEGQLVFKDGILAEVWKNWSPSNQQQGYELANNLYGLFNGLKEEGRTNCTLDATSNQTNGSETKTVTLICGEKEVRIVAVRWRRDDQPSETSILSEILKKRD